MRALTAAGAIAVVALAGACSEPVDKVAGPAGPVVGSSSAAPASAVSSSAPTTPAATTAIATKPANPCPVSAATLYRALRTSDIYRRGGKPDGLNKPNCYQGYAYARSTFDQTPDHEVAWILFQYDRSWKPINLGTGSVCEGYVSAAVRKRLNEGQGGC